MNRNDYIQSSVSTRILEKKLLKKETYDRLIEADSLEEFRKILSETDYSDSIKDMTSREQFDRELDRELVDMYNSFYNISPDKELVEILGSEYIFHDLKTILKSYILDRDLSYLLLDVGDYDYNEILDNLKKNGRVDDDLPFAKYMNHALEVYKEDDDPQKLDMQMDQHHYEYIMGLAKDLQVDQITDYIKNYADIQNINMIIRAKNQNHRVNCVDDFMIEGGNIPVSFFLENYFQDIETVVNMLKAHSLSDVLYQALELYLEDKNLGHFRDLLGSYLLGIGKEGQKETYGPEVLFSYMIAKEREIKILRIINVGKTNGLSADDIRRRIGDIGA